jgi:hypothetical protein
MDRGRRYRDRPRYHVADGSRPGRAPQNGPAISLDYNHGQQSFQEHGRQRQPEQCTSRQPPPYKSNRARHVHNGPDPASLLVTVPPLAPPAAQDDDKVDNNDCEIVCVDSGDCEYAEEIEARMKILGFEKVDLLFPNPSVSPDQIMSEIGARGVTFALIITPTNRAERSLTVNVLKGENGPTEHRALPLEDAMNVIVKCLERSINKKAAKEAISSICPAVPSVMTDGSAWKLYNDAEAALKVLDGKVRERPELKAGQEELRSRLSVILNNSMDTIQGGSRRTEAAGPSRQVQISNPNQICSPPQRHMPPQLPQPLLALLHPPRLQSDPVLEDQVSRFLKLKPNPLYGSWFTPELADLRKELSRATKQMRRNKGNLKCRERYIDLKRTMKYGAQKAKKAYVKSNNLSDEEADKIIKNYSRDRLKMLMSDDVDDAADMDSDDSSGDDISDDYEVKAASEPSCAAQVKDVDRFLDQMREKAASDKGGREDKGATASDQPQNKYADNAWWNADCAEAKSKLKAIERRVFRNGIPSEESRAESKQANIEFSRICRTAQRKHAASDAQPQKDKVDKKALENEEKDETDPKSSAADAAIPHSEDTEETKQERSKRINNERKIRKKKIAGGECLSVWYTQQLNDLRLEVKAAGSLAKQHPLKHFQVQKFVKMRNLYNQTVRRAKVDFIVRNDLKDEEADKIMKGYSQKIKLREQKKEEGSLDHDCDDDDEDDDEEAEPPPPGEDV